MKSRFESSIVYLQSRRAHRAMLSLLAMGLFVATASASPPPPRHEIPSDVTVQVLVKPEGRLLRVLVRVPLRAMRDVEFPLRGPGYLDIAHADDQLRQAAILWIGDELALYEGGARLTGQQLVAARASIPSDRSFASFDEALAHITGPRLPDATSLYWQQAMLDVLFEYPIESDESEFSIYPRLQRLALRVSTVLRFSPPEGGVRAFQYSGDAGLVRLDPRWHQSALRFVTSGFLHILDGIDHLLFLLCLVIPFRRLRPLIAIVTAFTVAHSITLIASAYDLAPSALWFPPLVETLIAASIVYMALENIAGASVHRRWMIAFGFGLVHGFGFSFALRDNLQFAGSYLLTSLLSFNLGVELGQILALVLIIPALEVLFRFVAKERIGAIILSALVAHTAWHWMTDRASVLRQFQIQWPALNLAVLVWIPIVAALGWLGYGMLKQHAARKRAEGPPLAVSRGTGIE